MTLPEKILSPSDLSDEQLIEYITKLDTAYEAGKPLVSDEEYDLVWFPALEKRTPEAPQVTQVRPQQFSSKGTVRHPARMLSAEKAYTEDETFAFIDRIMKVASDLGIHKDEVKFKISAKLDGISGRYDGGLYTRGDSYTGNIISYLIDDGLLIKGVPTTEGESNFGEITIPEEYFQKNMASVFDCSRNAISGLVDRVNDYNPVMKKALHDGAVHMVLYKDMPCVVATAKEIKEDLESLNSKAKESPYPIDGTIIEVVNEDIKRLMGATDKYPRWLLAKKEIGEVAETTVNEIVWQVSRQGKVTPVLMISPVRLSSATLNKATAHNAGYMVERQIGVGAVIKVTRAGEVIPKYLETITPAKPSIPTDCPDCSSKLDWEDDFLYCKNNLECPAQSTMAIHHHFKALKVKGFGKSTVQKLVFSGITSPLQVYSMNKDDFLTTGITAGVADNLLSELNRLKLEPIEDWRILSSLGIRHLGPATSEKIIKVHSLEKIPTLTVDDLLLIDSIADIRAFDIFNGLTMLNDLIKHFISGGYNIEMYTYNEKSNLNDHPLYGKTLVFTGTMVMGSRDDMIKTAKSVGATVSSSIGKKTDILVCGGKVGAKKISDAERFGTTTMTEKNYLSKYFLQK